MLLQTTAVSLPASPLKIYLPIAIDTAVLSKVPVHGIFFYGA